MVRGSLEALVAERRQKRGKDRERGEGSLTKDKLLLLWFNWQLTFALCSRVNWKLQGSAYARAQKTLSLCTEPQEGLSLGLRVMEARWPRQTSLWAWIGGGPHAVRGAHLWYPFTHLALILLRTPWQDRPCSAVKSMSAGFGWSSPHLGLISAWPLYNFMTLTKWFNLSDHLR